MWSSDLCQEQQQGPNLHCVQRKLHNGLHMESIWGCVSLDCGDRWGAAGSSVLSSQAADRSPASFHKVLTIIEAISFTRKKTNPDWQCHGISQKRKTILKCPWWAPLIHICVGLDGEKRSVFMGKEAETYQTWVLGHVTDHQGWRRHCVWQRRTQRPERCKNSTISYGRATARTYHSRVLSA